MGSSSVFLLLPTNSSLPPTSYHPTFNTLHYAAPPCPRLYCALAAFAFPSLPFARCACHLPAPPHKLLCMPSTTIPYHATAHTLSARACVHTAAACPRRLACPFLRYPLFYCLRIQSTVCLCPHPSLRQPISTTLPSTFISACAHLLCFLLRTLNAFSRAPAATCRHCAVAARTCAFPARFADSNLALPLDNAYTYACLFCLCARTHNGAHE